jgi:hypothetical protein
VAHIGAGWHGSVSFKTSGERHGVRCSRNLMSCRRDRGGREGAQAEAEGAEKEEWGTGSFKLVGMWEGWEKEMGGVRLCSRQRGEMEEGSGSV